ncbi:MAG TPA: integrase arm-type DNA-binding domain-containing protein, partial [Burkholderiales bacterium]|nr:integrase arm-type DNA-binding domain-containing protein [Burkholderiales bacterium]
MRTKSNTEAKLQSLLKGSKRRLAALKQKAESTGTSRRNIEAELANRIEDLSTMENIARAKALNGKPGRQVLTFEERRGLRLEYRGPRKLVFTYRYRAPDGYVKQLKIGRWPATSWEKACTKWEALSDARDEGRDPRQERLAKIQEAREKAKA